MLGKILRKPQAVLGLIIICFVLFVAIAAPVIAPHDPEAVDISQKYIEPCARYPLGTDRLGRCQLSRLIYGVRYSIGIALPTLLVLALIGLILGTLCACKGGLLDRIFIILCDISISFPALIAVIAIIGLLGNGLRNIAIAIVISMWAWFTRMVRSYAVLEMGKDYITSAEIAGCGTAKIVVYHLIPNIMPQYLVYLSTGVASTILMISSFAFLGLGLPDGISEWGAMLNEARTGLYSHPEMLIYPGVCILIAAAGFNLFGEALRDIIAPEDTC